MFRTILALCTGTVLITACADAPTTDATRRDDAYVPIGSNIPRRDTKPQERVSAPLPPGPYISGPNAAPRN